VEKEDEFWCHTLYSSNAAAMAAAAVEPPLVKTKTTLPRRYTVPRIYIYFRAV